MSNITPLTRDDYKAIIQKPMWDFITQSEQFSCSSQEITEVRQTYKKMCQHFYAGRPSTINVINDAIITPYGKLSLRYYEPHETKDEIVLLYVHGGGFILGDVDSHDDVCAEIAAGAHRKVVALNYRLAPEHPHPAAFEDVLTLYDYLTQEHPVILIGDSAGGTLVASVVAARKNSTSPPLGQLLIYPALGGGLTVYSKSYDQHANAPLLSADEMNLYYQLWGAQADDITAEPLTNKDFSAYPATFVISAECDPLASDSYLYCQALEKADSKAIFYAGHGLVHGFLRARHACPQSAQAFKEIINQASNLPALP